ncbi:putative ankyrin repeat-containing domain-containing protein [Helianthus anomalus]
MPTYFPLRWESTGDQWWFASPIDWAAANGHYDLVRELLRMDGNHLIKLTSLRRIRRLEVVWDDEEQFECVAKNRSFVARRLLHEGECRRGKSSLIGSGYGGWLLYTAASAGDLHFVQELLQKDPLLVFGEGEYGVTDILYAAARSKNCEVFWVIYDFAMSPRFMSGNGRESEEHIGEIPFGYKQEMKNRAVHALARGGNLKILKELLGDCSVEDVLAYRDVQCSTILHTSAARGQVEVVKDLISVFGMINSTDKQGNTALHIAAYRGQLSTVEVLIQACPESIHSRNNAGETFLHKAVTGFQTPTFRRLDRQIVLMKQLVCSKSFKIEETINATDNDGRTPLHLAISGNLHSDLVELLMIAGSLDVNIRDNNGMAPLDLLKQRPGSASSELLTRQLISAGATLSSQDYTARKLFASRLRMGGNGGGGGGGTSPGTSFKLSDSEVFMYTGMDSATSTAYGTPTFSMHSPGLSQLDSSSNSNSNVEPKTVKKSKQKGIQRFLRWIRTIKKGKQGSVSTQNFKEIPVPLRQQYSNASSLPNNKRTLAARSNLPSPTVKKKLASGLVNGVMQAMPHLTRGSRSHSFSKSSLSSDNSLDNKQKGIDVVGSSNSNHMFDDGVDEEQGVVNSRPSVNQWLCFGGPPGIPTEGSGGDQQRHEIFDRSTAQMIGN